MGRVPERFGLISARAQTEADGQIVGNIVNQLLVPTSFSSVK